MLLVERNDFCSGCSAAPSRMIHGGLRYLENGEFKLVWESLRERDALLANAPHMVRPLPTTIPINSLFSGMMNGAVGFFGLSGRPASRGALPIKIGLMLYDWITRHRRLLPKHRFRGARETLALWPALSPRLRFSATYHDAWISHPERLGVELLLDTRRLAPDSVALNYAELRPEGERWLSLDGQIRRDAARHGAGDRQRHGRVAGRIRSACLQTAGPGASPSCPAPKGRISSSIIPSFTSALGGHMIFFEHDDGRVCIVFPYLGKVLVGSTDIRVERAGRVRCEPEERDYILAALRSVFPGIAVGPEHVVFSYSGIRPLPSSDHEFTGRISRGHFVHRARRRSAAVLHGRRQVDDVPRLRRADRRRGARRARPQRGSRTRSRSPIGGGAGFPK